MAERKEQSRIPQHVAVILDGNGRWAKKRRMPRTYGHAQGSKNVETICRAADEIGIRYDAAAGQLYERIIETEQTE